ncbi:The GLUG motif-containing protein [Fibrobacter sp. UWCM]|uniref:GLUG motif-containing protein n=1 Tax=Fibrobacter sp. UWCM TaxID=1896208 RepID=UPI000923174D|nr:GLUG motif-containing protein [Fibrobacter sp. UWCM]SHH59413.1 The GLUG motif-containing protein [Fibrobacter sp. UWCM]
MTNKLSVFWGALLAVPCLATNGNMAGAGTAESPWQVADYEDLKAVGLGDYGMDGHYVLVADIDASASRNEKSEVDSTAGFLPIGAAYYGTEQSEFGGVFDGADHTISHLYSETKDERSTALFMGIGSSGVVKNLKMADCFISVRFVWAAASVAVMNSGLIENIELVRDTVSAPGNTGGVVGVNEDGTVENVDFSGVVRGINDRDFVGGIVGYNAGEKSVIRNVKVNADMRSSYYGNNLGLVAGVNQGTIISAEVDGVLDHGNRFLGGVTGNNSGIIDSCVSHASIFSMNEKTGGLVGFNSGVVKNSSVDADSVFSEFRGAAGFVGVNDTTGVIENCNAQTNVHSDSSGGFAVYNAGIIRDSYVEGSVSSDSFPGRFVSGFVVYNVGTISKSYSKADVDAFNGLAGFVLWNSGKIDSSYATGHVLNGERASGDTFGGFVGQNDSTGIITNSYAAGEVVGGMKAGGFVGVNNGKIHNCYATGDVRSYSVFGGFVGENWGEILYAYSTGNLGNIKGYTSSFTAGGFVGANNGYINNAYTTGNVNSEFTPGGFVSSNSGTIKNAYASGDVSGRIEFGGFASANRQYLENVFFAGKLIASSSDYEAPGCFVVNNSGTVKEALYNKDGCEFEADSSAKETAFADMKASALYKGWNDFEKFWLVGDTLSFPHLVFTTGVLPEIPEVEPPVKVVKPDMVVAMGANGLKLYGNRQNLQAMVTLSRLGETNVKVYNLKGRLLKTITLGMMGEGVHQVDLSGAAETRGMSLFMLEQDGRMLSRSVLR